MEEESVPTRVDGAPGDPVLCLVGDVDLANAADHGDELCAVVDALQADVVHVDCSQLDLLESQGMAMMVRVHRHAEDQSTRVVWDGLAARHRVVLELTGLDDYLHLGTDRAAEN